jgi:hypothetical protein
VAGMRNTENERGILMRKPDGNLSL